MNASETIIRVWTFMFALPLYYCSKAVHNYVWPAATYTVYISLHTGSVTYGIIHVYTNVHM